MGMSGDEWFKKDVLSGRFSHVALLFTGFMSTMSRNISMADVVIYHCLLKTLFLLV
jgi:hypothetical protein